jgi:hypothetical protein
MTNDLAQAADHMVFVARWLGTGAWYWASDTVFQNNNNIVSKKSDNQEVVKW